MASWRPSARLEPVERYDRFEILGRIGRGGMAEILLARERSLTGGSRHLVIKRVLPEVRDFDELLHMFLDETRVVMGLSHPNLCQIYEVGEQDGSWFIAMEWVNGVTLHQLLRRALESGDIDYGVIARVISQCAEALHYAHTARDAEGQLISLVHRDVSPHNLMIAYDGRVKLLDFGIAKSTATTHRTEAGVVKGKICYMAPEQWLAQPLDGRSDVFSLGACLYEALSGRVVFKRENQAEVMKAAIGGDVPPLRDVAPRVPQALAAIAHRALEAKPERRYQTAREMSEALERFLVTHSSPISAARISDYTRRLFRSELQLGPVLERSLRGAQLDPVLDLALPPLPASLLALAGSASLRPPAPPVSISTAPALSRPQARVLGAPPATVAERPWPAEGAFDGEVLTERARIGATRTAPVRAVDETLETPSEAPTDPKLHSPRELDPGPEVARPLARTLSLRVVRGARRALMPSLLGIAVVVPLLFGLHALVRGEPAASLPQSADSPTAAQPAPDFTLLPAGAPLTQAPARQRELRLAEARDHLAGRLSINTKPWSTVYLGKRLLGTTPLDDIEVPRDALNLRLVDRDGKVHIRRVPASQKKARSVQYTF